MSEEPKSVTIQEAVEHFMKNNEKTNLLIATPCYGNVCGMGYMNSISNLSIALTRLNIPFSLMTLGQESLITRARNSMVAKFIENKEFSHLMFIDADITFHWMSVVRLLLCGKDVCGACYPKKGINWEKVKRQVTNNPEIEIKELLPKSLDYVYNPVVKKVEEDKYVMEAEGDLVKVKDVATGFMMIKRQVIYKMIEEYKHTQYKNNVAGYGNSEWFYALFDTEIDEDSRVYLSEDYLFCKRWMKMGGELWMDIGTNLVHSGTFDYQGSLGLNIREPDDLNADAKMMSGSK